jgi:GNAT superfamily N-acetyltransferase
MRTLRETLNYLLREDIEEIRRSGSHTAKYNEFIDWAKSEADKISTDRVSFQGFEFQWAESDHVKLIVYLNGETVGYVALEKFLDGYKIDALGVKPAVRGAGIAMKAYGYILTRTKLYSDKLQSPEARKLWVRLSKVYDVKGIDIKTKQTFDIEPNNKGHELRPVDNSNNLYSRKKAGDIHLVIEKI